MPKFIGPLVGFLLALTLFENGALAAVREVEGFDDVGSGTHYSVTKAPPEIQQFIAAVNQLVRKYKRGISPSEQLVAELQSKGRGLQTSNINETLLIDDAQDQLRQLQEIAETHAAEITDAQKQNRLEQKAKAALKKNSSKISALGFSKSFLRSDIYFVLAGETSKWLRYDRWLALVFDNPRVSSVTVVRSFDNRYRGIAVKIPGKVTVGFFFREDHGDLFPAAAGIGDHVSELRTIGDQVAFSLSLQKVAGEQPIESAR